MIRRKKLAILRRQQATKQKVLDEIAEAKTKKAEASERRKQQKKLKDWRAADFRRKYNEAFGDCKAHEPQVTWAEGPTTKPRSVLDNY